MIDYVLKINEQNKERKITPTKMWKDLIVKKMAIKKWQSTAAEDITINASHRRLHKFSIKNTTSY